MNKYLKKNKIKIKYKYIVFIKKKSNNPNMK